MYIDVVPNRKSPSAILLRESEREGKRIVKKTLANLSAWPQPQVDALRRILRGEAMVPVNGVFAVERSRPHGHVEAVLGTLRKIGLEEVLASRRSRERDLVEAMIVAQLLYADSKLADTRLWHTSTLAEELGVADADEDELYAALDWLLGRQKAIEKKLAKRHLVEGKPVFYDVSSSYYHGHTCSLAEFGHDRDGKKGLPVIVYGVLADSEGRPVAVQVYPGNTGDPTTVPDQVQKLRDKFGLERVILVGDRGMLTETQIEYVRQFPGLGWISALRSKAIRELMDQGPLQLSLFDRKNLAEIHSPEYPGERLVACYNPLLAEDRRRTRRELLDATEEGLEKIRREAMRRRKTPLTAAEIGQKVGKVIGRYKMGKHFRLRITEGKLDWEREKEAISREEQLDGIYVVRTSEPAERLAAADVVRQYKNLARVEQVFRTCKGLEILVRPIRHRLADRVRAHIFLCLLAYYVEWHMRQALAPLLFDDEEIAQLRQTRDPVAIAEPSPSAQSKKMVRVTPDGLPIHSFKTLLKALQTRCRNTCRVLSDKVTSTFQQTTEPDTLQTKALKLLGLSRTGCTQ